MHAWLQLVTCQQLRLPHDFQRTSIQSVTVCTLFSCMGALVLPALLDSGMGNIARD